MIKSMTGFGKATKAWQDKKLTAEARSLNSKQLDLSMRLPGAYREKELELRTEAGKIIERGKADISVYIEFTGEIKAVSINKPLALNYYKELKSFSEEIKESNNVLPLILKMPEVMRSEKQEPDEKEWAHIRETVMEAIQQMEKFRRDEGKVLEKEITNRINSISKLLTEVELFDKERMPLIREKMRKNIAEFIAEEKIDQNRFEQEMIYYIEKLDITEEKLRLKTHCDYFLKTMQEPGAGRKLGFISQELGREINTIGSKCNDAKMQQAVVQMKDELEKIKEQLLNVL
jgi:uncharacterized protein (TIGR00255 family)